jgi:predicted 3-demethylubiquinone-9 3-methyltransferase (glyoxalase superfamily)
MPARIHPRIAPMLWFNDNAEDAARFYTSIFPNSRITAISHYGDVRPASKGKVMTVSFELDGQPFTALNGGPSAKFTEAVSFVVSCDTQAEIDSYWEKLTAGGGSPVQCGWLRDRFGLSWQVVPANIFELISNPATSNRVMNAVVQMIKLDIARLEAAAAGT